MNIESSVLSCILLVTTYVWVIAQKTEPPDEDEEPVKEVCQFLIDTDKKLVDKYSARPKGEGQEIMAMVRKYNDALSSIVQKAMKESKKGENITICEAQALIDHGGPQFINLYVERNVLEETFGLNNVSSRILCGQRQNTVDIWQDFYRVYSKIKDEEEEDE